MFKCTWFLMHKYFILTRFEKPVYQACSFLATKASTTSQHNTTYLSSLQSHVFSLRAPSVLKQNRTAACCDEPTRVSFQNHVTPTVNNDITALPSGGAPQQQSAISGRTEKQGSVKMKPRHRAVTLK